MIVTTKKLFEHAYGKYAQARITSTIWNKSKVSSKELAISSPLYHSDAGACSRSYTNKLYLEALIRTADQIYPEAIFAYLDHGDEATCYDCIEFSFYSSVMIDGSMLPYEENVAVTKRVVEAAHAKGVWLKRN